MNSPVASYRRPGAVATPLRPAADGSAAAAARALRHGGALWLHLHLPQLPLEVLTRGLGGGEPRVLIEREQRRPTILLGDHRAAALGMRAGMPLAAAYALGHCRVLERNTRAEQRALHQLGLWAMQFTPQVSLVAPDGLVLEIRGSLKLFGGLEALLAAVRKGVRTLGYRADYAVAPTPLAAGVLARAEPRATVLDRQQLTARLAALPLAALRLETDWHDALAQLGVRRLGECRRLPRAGLAQRFAPQLNAVLDRLFGKMPDPRAALALPRCFEATVDLPWEVDNARTLVTAAERLLRELCGFLHAHQALARRLCWSLGERDGRRESFTLELARPARECEHMLLVVREAFARRRLAQPVCGITLAVDALEFAAPGMSRDLFTSTGTEGEACAAFIDRLRARYGDAALHTLRLRSAHRPEQAFSRADPALIRKPSAARAGASGARCAPRPLWLLERPARLATQAGRPIFQGALQLIPERERIQNGWWDADAMARDYFIATTPRGGRLWVYRELQGTRAWYLHGIFE